MAIGVFCFCQSRDKRMVATTVIALAVAVIAIAVCAYFYYFGIQSSYLRVLRPNLTLKEGCIVSATQLGISSWWYLPRLLKLGAPIVLRQLASEQCISWGWCARPALRLFWLYSVWEKPQHLKSFAHGSHGPHHKVADMRESNFTAAAYPNFGVRTWTIDGTANEMYRYPDWDDVRSRFSRSATDNEKAVADLRNNTNPHAR